MVFLHSSLHALALLPLIMLQMHNEGVYILFPSCALKLSNLHIQFYLLALTILNASYLLRTRAKGSRSDYNVQVRFILMTLLCLRNNSKVISKFVLACPAVLRFHAGSLDVKAMLLHHTPRIENFHGLLSMSSRTVCPCL
jgi:hypothetical protein